MNVPALALTWTKFLGVTGKMWRVVSIWGYMCFWQSSSLADPLSEERIKQIESQIAEHGGSEKLYLARAGLHLEHVRTKEALADVALARQCNPASGPACTMEAQILLAAGKPGDAWAAAETALTRGHIGSSNFALCGHAAFAAEKYMRARECFLKALELSNNSAPEFYFSLARCEWRLGASPEKFVKLLEQYVEKSGGDMIVRELAADLLASEKLYTEAVVFLEPVIKSLARPEVMLVKKGQWLAAAGDVRAAGAAGKTALELIARLPARTQNLPAITTAKAQAGVLVKTAESPPASSPPPAAAPSISPKLQP